MASDMLEAKNNIVSLSAHAHAHRQTPLPLCEQVKLILTEYFEKLDGESTVGLYELVMNEVERPLLQVTLERCNYNQSRASLMLGISRGTLRKKISQYNLE